MSQTTPSTPNPDMGDRSLSEARSSGRPDTEACRICRAEGSKDEPLFYPCRCSGSIKFVHQDCLMEWLSHTQKKYCELCKTPFRFTKLYDPKMPQSLPTTVFLRRASIHIANHILFWLRTGLVGSVWLFLLPWAMRYTWRALFWLGDAGWARDVALETSWSVDRFNETLLSSSKPNLVATLQKRSTLLSSINLTMDEPFLYKVGKTLFTGIMLPFGRLDLLDAVVSNSSAIDPTLAQMIRQKHSSILSDVPLLKNISDSAVVNRVITDTLEGILITFLVVVAFILIFLIREWVVQQQPVLDIAGADADNALAQAGGEARRPVDDGTEEPQAQPAQEGDERVGQGHQSDFDGSDTSSSSSSTPSNVGELDQGFIFPMEDLPDLRDSATQTSAEAEPHLQSGGNVFSDAGRHSNQTNRRNSTSSSVTEPSDSREDVHWTRDAQPGFSKDEESYFSGSGNSNTSGEFAWNRPVVIDGPEASNHERPYGAHPPPTPHPHPQPHPTLQERLDLHHRDISASLANGEHGSEHRSKVSSSANELTAVENRNSISKEKDEEKMPSRLNTSSSDELRTQSGSNIAPDSTVNTRDFSTQTVPYEDVESSRDDTPNSGEITQLGRAELSNQSYPQAESATNLQQAQPRSLLDKAFDFFWGDVNLPDNQRNLEDAGNDEHVVADIEQEAPFVRFAQAEPVFDEPEPEDPGNEARNFDADVGNGGVGAGGDPNDPEAIDDVEDLEGVLELIGMQGPIAGLFQNALFSSLLVMVTILGTVFLPYLLGKLVLVCVIFPSLVWRVPLFIASTIADLALDIVIFVAGFVANILSSVWQYACTALSSLYPSALEYCHVGSSLRGFAEKAGMKLWNSIDDVTSHAQRSSLLGFSMMSHAGLREIYRTVGTWIQYLINSPFSGDAISVKDVHNFLRPLIYDVPKSLFYSLVQDLHDLSQLMKKFLATGTISLSTGPGVLENTFFDPLLAYWSAWDRTCTVVTGYACVALLGTFYLTHLAPLTSSTQGRRVEQVVIDVIQQAGGVLKVIFIISIEMIAFPLFCGFLLDYALLPLFENSTIVTRIDFTMVSPWTSGFVHWFVGTCYMFHFALFVSMCRKIMRPGVLYFIRDPDDPTFHPVRDVLERNVTTQLRKIAFSALVYGALIVVCLGGVVWGLWMASDHVLPIRWTSAESALEFPLDILFFNFLTPVVLRYVKPTDGLHAMYKWWFRSCSRALRLSDFLFKERHPDEEGHYNTSWREWLSKSRAQLEKKGETRKTRTDLPGPNFVFDGKYVRVPASDQIKIPKGGTVFVEVDRNNNRLDHKSENEGVHARNSTMTTTVYIPPWFKTRIGLFVVAVWIFAAATGVCVTIVPLLFGRFLLRILLPDLASINDIYAFSLGIYLLGSTLYLTLRLPSLLSTLRTHVLPARASLTSLARVLFAYAYRAVSIFYLYTSLFIGIPILFVLTLELYLLMPLHLYLGPHEQHIVHLIQDLTLGILFVRIIARAALANPLSRLGRFARALATALINENNPLDPKPWVVTRAVIIPGALVFGALALVPWAVAGVANATVFRGESEERKLIVLRFAYPLTLCLASWVWISVVLVHAMRKWKARIRDEVYLIGERLHNFGERRGMVPGREKGRSEKGGEGVGV